MNDAPLTRLEADLDRQLRELPPLPDAAPSAAAVARTRAAVHAAALARGRQQPRRRMWRSGLGLAAAVLLGVVLWPPAARGPEDAHLSRGADPAGVAFDEWAAAWDETEQQVGDLLEGGWLEVGFEDDTVDAELNELFESMETTLERFEEL